MAQPPTDDRTETTRIAFTPAVEAMQARLGTREQMARMARKRGFRTEITEDLAGFVAGVESFFLGTVTADGYPYIQHRGGPPGFLSVVDRQRLRFPDYAGNRQFLTLGNLTENDRVHLFLIDYETRTRIKIWGRAQVLDLTGDRQIEVTIEAWDVNCQQHLPDLYRHATVETVTARLMARIAELEQVLAATGQPDDTQP